MALWDDVFKNGGISTGVAFGIGAAILAPVLLPVAATIVKPLAKEAIKLGVALYEKGTEAIAEAGEVIEDLVAEAKAEIAAQRESPPVVMPESERSG